MYEVLRSTYFAECVEHGTTPLRSLVSGGEDAFFVLENDFGVFDGVGAWAAKGHDPGVFARGFAQAVAGISLLYNDLLKIKTALVGEHAALGNMESLAL